MESADLAPGTRHPLPRRTFVTLVAGGLLAAPLVAEAQRTGVVYRIGAILREGRTTPLSTGCAMASKTWGSTRESSSPSTCARPKVF